MRSESNSKVYNSTGFTKYFFGSSYEKLVVTGVSTGIGWGITKVLIQKGFRVYGSVRKTQDAEAARPIWRDSGEFLPSHYSEIVTETNDGYYHR